ncbi:hypothetical protein GCM10012275_36870 [Longimycelium tulufanense]|uniref:Uncharacterized protein n=1 Tax=Longimycelium tulufanense TaxID=907463 RepID=A0A8J3FVD7_9PSEU|nr:hypothetical protein GCM10012275_36870 [Longimycelium tulufanense]
MDVFEYQVHGVGVAAICLRPDPAPRDPREIGLPPRSPVDYVLTLLVGVPQAELGLAP